MSPPSTNADVKGARVGEAALLVRYQGKFVTLPVTVLNPKPGFAWKQLPQHNYIDQLIDAKLQALKIQPSPAIGDAEFLRRASLDLTGQTPTPEEVKAFLADRTPSQAKRSQAHRQADREPGVRRSLDRQVGRPAAEQPQISGRKGRLRFPGMDPPIVR